MSLPLSDTVTLTITQDSVGVARAGFGVPLLLSAYAAFAERVRYYGSLAEVAADFPVTSSPEYLAANAIFSQEPKPTRIAIGRSALKPTQVYTISVASIQNTHAYVINVKGKGVTSTAATFTSDGTATDAEIVAGLVTALNAVTGNNYIAAGASSPFTVTGDAAGDWFSLEVNPVDLTAAQTHADPGVATDLTAIRLETDDWYALTTWYNSDAYVKAAAAFIEAQKKIYVFDIAETEAVTDASDGTQGTLDDLMTLAYARTAGLYHPSAADMAGPAWLGKCLPFNPGEETWKFKRLAGVNPVTLTSTQRTNLRARNANSYEVSGGINMTWNGTTVDGNYIDIRRGLDWLDDDMSKSVFEVLAGAAKVPFTDAGIALIENAMRGSLKRAVARTILIPGFTVTVPLAKDVSSINKAARILPDLKFAATLAGAVHHADVAGVVSL